MLEAANILKAGTNWHGTKCCDTVGECECSKGGNEQN